ncbi:MAG: hypothetical protein PSX81_11680 [bacterium]|nr:hypothetical protein [bacterium]
MKQIIFITLLFSCNNKVATKGEPTENGIFNVHFIQEQGYGKLKAFTHYIILQKKAMSDSECVSFSKLYVDTLSNKKKPVYSIVFLKSLENFSVIPDSQHWDLITKCFNKELIF